MAQKPPARGSRTATKPASRTGLKRTSEPDARPARSHRARPEPRPAPKRSASGEGGSTRRPGSGAARPTATRPDSTEKRPSTRRSAAEEGMIIAKRPGAGTKRTESTETRPLSRRSTPGEGRPHAKRPGSGSTRPATKRPESAETRPTSRRSTTTENRPAVKRSGPARPSAKHPEAPEAKPAPKRPAPRRTGNRSGGDGERLHKLLAHAGIASRRACEELILEGRVQVNGETVTELGAKAHPYRDEITVDFVPIHKEAPVYLLMNKPKGYVTTVKDDEGRPTVMALLQGIQERVYPVGRLDFQSEGLLLLTNDGELAHRLTTPDFHIPKVYLVKVHRMPPPELLKEFRDGFRLDGRRLKPCGIEVMDRQGNPWLKVTLTEGKNQQIRRMFAAVGHPVHKLRRIQFGPLDDPALKPGAWRPLTAQEIAALKSL